jgi:mannosyltransferase
LKWLGALVPGLVATVIGFWRADGASLWADELATWGAVRLSWSQLWQLTGNVDGVLTPYYAVLKAYTGLVGVSALSLRLPSIVAMVAATMIVAGLGRRIGGSRAGLIAGLLYAILPATSRYAQEARPYAGVMLFAALATWTLIRLTERPTMPRSMAYALAVAATGLANPLDAALMLLGHGLAARTRQWLIPAVLGCGPVLGVGLRGLGQSAQVSWITRVDLDTLKAAPQAVFGSAALGGVILALALLGLRRTTASTILAGAGFLPPVALMIAGIWAHVWVGRYALVGVPALTALAGAAAARAGRPHAALVTAVCAVLAWPQQRELRRSDGHDQDSAKLQDVIGPLYLPGDVAIFPDSHPSIPWAARDIYALYLREPKPPDVLMISPQRTDGRFLAAECPVASCLGSPPRIWIIRTDDSPDPLRDMGVPKRHLIQGNYQTVARWQFPLLQVTLMSLKGG